MGVFGKIKESLAKTRESINGKFENVVKSFVKIDEDLFDELEEMLIMSDVGVNTSVYIVDRLRDAAKEKRLTNSEELREELHTILTEILCGEREEKVALSGKPAVIMVIGVNGVGKTTSIGKIANMYKIKR